MDTPDYAIFKKLDAAYNKNTLQDLQRELTIQKGCFLPSILVLPETLE